MEFKRQHIQADLIAPICDKCNKGYLIHYGTPLKTNPKQWQHKCNNCGDECYLTKPYPIIESKGSEYGPLEAVRFEVEKKEMTHGNG
jgi:hypothetical protein